MDNLHARMQHESEEVQPTVVAAPRESSRRYTSPHPAPATPKTPPKRRRVWMILVAALVVVALLFAVAWRFFGVNDGIDHGKYQAVFLSSSTLPSNVYFGKLERMGNGYFKLTDVYYLQTPTDKTEQANTTLTVVKMTKEAHAPEDSLVLPREQILYYQNMTNDSKVVQFIKQDSQKN